MNVVSNSSWFSRIGQSIKGIFAGIVLTLISVVLLVANERNAVRDIRANKELAQNAVSVANDKVDANKEGKLIHLNGPSITSDVVTNDQFDLSENAIRLRWSSEIYQWDERSENKTEKKVGGGETTTTTYYYDKKWVSAPIDSSSFQEPVGHENNSTQQFDSGQSQAQTVTVGAFTLPKPLINDITSSAPYPLQEVPPTLASETANISEGVFYTGDANAPAIGDERVTFSLTEPGNVSVMAVQSGNTFEPWTAKNGKTRFILMEGLHSADEVIAAEEQKAKFLRWALRIGGFIIMSIGLGLLLKPLSVLADVIPFMGNLVGAATGFIAMMIAAGITLIIIAISWVTFRPLIAVPILVVALVALFFGIKKLTPNPSSPQAV